MLISFGHLENELFKQQLDLSDAQQVAYYHKKRGAIRAEGNAWKALREHRAQKPGLWDRITNDEWSEKDEALKEPYNQAEQALRRLNVKSPLNGSPEIRSSLDIGPVDGRPWNGMAWWPHAQQIFRCWSVLFRW